MLANGANVFVYHIRLKLGHRLVDGCVVPELHIYTAFSFQDF